MHFEKRAEKTRSGWIVAQSGDFACLPRETLPGAFPIFCNRLCYWGKTTLPGVNTTVRFIKTWQ
ncbi:MAG: hypothetical protein NUV76_01590, partial [Candidatus Kuenenia sp.]|nr:hypothetical protein [Candidatus Kuenenia sp.]